MSDIVEFLLARISEDEDVAQRLSDDLKNQIEASDLKGDELGPLTPQRMLKAQLWAHFDGQTRWRNFARGQYIARLASPERTLAECAAKRRIVTAASGWMGDGGEGGYVSEQVLRNLSQPYADHPDFDPDWKITPM